MTPSRHRNLLSYLGDCSPVAVSNVYLKSLSDVDKFRRELHDVLTSLAEALVVSRIAEIVRRPAPEEIDLGNAAVEVSPANWWHWIFRDLTIQRTEKLVLMAMKLYQANNGEIRATFAQIARSACLCRISVVRALKRLRKRGIVVSTYTGRSNVFRIIPTSITIPVSKQPSLPPVSMNRPGETKPLVPAFASARDEREARIRGELVVGANPIANEPMTERKREKVLAAVRKHRGER